MKIKNTLGVLAVSALLGVSSVIAAEYEENIYKKIAPDGENIYLKIAEPKNLIEVDSLYGLLATKLNDENFDPYLTCNDGDYVNCKLDINGIDEYESFSKSYDVKVHYEAPKENKKVEDIKKAFGEFDVDDASTYFTVTDLSLIHYYLTGSKSELWNNLAGNRAIKFSDKALKLAKGTNITFVVDNRMGMADEALLYETAVGNISVLYDGYSFGAMQHGLYLKRVLYVPETTEDTVAAYKAAIEKRISDYLGNNTSFKVEEGLEISTLSEDVKDPLIDETKAFNKYFNITIKPGTNDERTYKFYAMKGTKEDLVEPTYIGTDIDSEIYITSDDSSVPLDSALTVETVTDDNIKKVLETDKYHAYDIELFSEATNAKIEKINGKFIVNIPIPKEYEGKTLTVYYIDSNNKKVEHTINPEKVKDGIASFETDHFSTYILTEKEELKKEETPETIDNIVIYIVISATSLLAATGAVLNLRKN